MTDDEREVFRFLLRYEVAASWWVSRLPPFDWMHQLAADHFRRKVERKFGKLIRLKNAMDAEEAA